MKTAIMVLGTIGTMWGAIFAAILFGLSFSEDPDRYTLFALSCTLATCFSFYSTKRCYRNQLKGFWGFSLYVAAIWQLLSASIIGAAFMAAAAIIETRREHQEHQEAISTQMVPR